MLSPELLKILCCPKCRGKVVYDQTKNTLTCSECRRVYPVENDIPVMLVDNKPSLPSYHD